MNIINKDFLLSTTCMQDINSFYSSSFLIYNSNNKTVIKNLNSFLSPFFYMEVVL